MVTPLHVVSYLKATHSRLHKLFKRTQDGIYIWSGKFRNKNGTCEEVFKVHALKYATIPYIAISFDLQPIL